MTEKIFVLSLHRCATRSTLMLLKNLGYETVHWPNWIEDECIEYTYTDHETDLEYIYGQLDYSLKKYDALADVPVPVLYRQAHKQFPRAKFILVYRNPFDWVRSVRGLYKGACSGSS